MKSFRIKRIEDFAYMPSPDAAPLFQSDPLQPEFAGQTECIVRTVVRYEVQMKYLFVWITVKSFQDEEEEWARMCAEDLLNKLNEEP